MYIYRIFDNSVNNFHGQLERTKLNNAWPARNGHGVAMPLEWRRDLRCARAGRLPSRPRSPRVTRGAIDGRILVSRRL